MIKKLGILGVLFVLTTVLVSATDNSELRVDNIRFLDYTLKRGTHSEMIITLENFMSSKINDLEINVMTLEEYEPLNVYSREFDLTRGDKENKHILLYIPKNIDAGYTLLRITISNGNEKRTKIVGVYIV